MSDDTKTELLPDGLPRILPPSNDMVFRSVMTLPEAHPALVSAVAAFLDRPVKTVTLRNNDAPSRDKDAKQEQYDVNCVVDGEDGDQADVEMQTSPMEGDSAGNAHRNLRSRIVYNLADLHANQPGRGKRFADFVRSYQITLCNYRVFKHENKLSEPFLFRNEEGIVLSEDATAILIDLTQARRIAKKPVAEMSELEVWVVFFALANVPRYRGIVEEITRFREGIAVADTTLLSISQNPDERARFRSHRMWLQDREHEHAVWLHKGRDEARAEYEPLLADKDAALADKDATVAWQAAALADKDAALAEQAALIAELRAKLERGSP